MNNVYILQNWGGGSGLDYVILLSEGGEGLGLDNGGGEGGKKCQKFDYVICERPLTIKSRANILTRVQSMTL